MPMNAKTFFSDRPIAYHPILAKVFGSVTAALFLSQLGYWSDKGADPNGWIWKTESEMTDETGLSRSEQQTAREVLVWTGVLQEKRKGVPARMWFKIDWDMLDIVLTEYANELSSRQVAAMTQQDAEQPQLVVENRQQEDENPQTIQRLHSEITPENNAPDGGDISWDDLHSASEGEPKATIDSLKAKVPVDKQLATMIISIIRQNELSVENYRTVATAVRKRAEYAASLVANDLHSGKYMWGDVESAYKYLMNGGGEKYRMYTCAPNTVAADIGEWIAKKKTAPPPRPLAPTANMSPFPE